MAIVRILYTSTEKEMLSAEIVVVFEHPRGTTFFSDEVFWRIMATAGCGVGPGRVDHEESVQRLWRRTV